MILPVAVWVLWNTLIPNPVSSQKVTPTGKRESIGRLILASVSLAGLALTHYRVMVLAMIFLVILWIIYARHATIRSIFNKTLWIGVGAGLLFLPWFIHLYGGRLSRIFMRQMSTPAAKILEADPTLAGTGNLSTYLPLLLWLALPVIIGFGLWKREKNLLLIGLWWFANTLAGNPTWLGLPGAAVLSSGFVFIAMYIPAAMIVGAAVGWLEESRNPTINQHSIWMNILSIGAAILFVGAGVWGAEQRIKDVRPNSSTVSFTLPPGRISWPLRGYQANTPAEVRFLVNSMVNDPETYIAGTDGGYWLPLLARRQDTVPPLNYGLESNPSPNYYNQTGALTREIQAKGITDSEVISQLKDRNISYIYIGERQGQLYSGQPQLLTVGQLLSDPIFRQIYHQDRVWIFQIQPAP